MEFSLKNSPYLDLSFNQISSIDSRFFSRRTFNVPNSLKYLNLENNKIFSIESVFTNCLNLEFLKLSNNFLNETVSFDVFWNGTYLPSNYEFFFENNKLKIIKKIPPCLFSLKYLNFDFNEISLIEFNAFFVSKSLEKLTIAKNFIENITENNFHFLFSLKYLNLSWNRINSIEKN